jgi:hypothetical protein
LAKVYDGEGGEVRESPGNGQQKLKRLIHKPYDRQHTAVVVPPFWKRTGVVYPCGHQPGLKAIAAMSRPFAKNPDGKQFLSVDCGSAF